MKMKLNDIININTLQIHHGPAPDLKNYKSVIDMVENFCYINDCKSLQKLIDQGLDVRDLKDNIIITAVKRGNYECVKMLIDHGASPYIKDDDNRRLTKIARDYKYDKIYRYLVNASELKAKSEASITNDKMDLYKYVDQNKSHAFDSSVDGKESNKQDTNDVISKLMKLAINGDMKRFMSYLDTLNITDHCESEVWKYGLSNMLSLLCFNNDYIFVEYILKTFPDTDVNQVHTKDSCSYNPLTASAISGNINMMILLIQHEAEFPLDIDNIRKIKNKDAIELLINTGMLDKDLYNSICVDC